LCRRSCMCIRSHCWRCTLMSYSMWCRQRMLQITCRLCTKIQIVLHQKAFTHTYRSPSMWRWQCSPSHRIRTCLDRVYGRCPLPDCNMLREWSSPWLRGSVQIRLNNQSTAFFKPRMCIYYTPCIYYWLFAPPLVSSSVHSPFTPLRKYFSGYMWTLYSHQRFVLTAHLHCIE
jgi:hypothetical protein